MPELDLQKDINRAIELLKTLQSNPSLPRLVSNDLRILIQTFTAFEHKLCYITCINERKRQAEITSRSIRIRFSVLNNERLSINL